MADTLVQDEGLEEKLSSEVADPAANFRALFNNTSDCAFQLRVEEGPRFVYENVNPAGLAATRLTREDLVGRTPLDVLGPEKGGMMTEGLMCAWETGESYHYEPTWNLPGGVVTYDAAYIPIKDAAGKVTGIFGVARDVTAQRRSGVGNAPVALEMAGPQSGHAAHGASACSAAAHRSSVSIYGWVLRHLKSIADLSDFEEAAIRNLPVRIRNYARSEDIIVPGRPLKEVCLVLEGVACRSLTFSPSRRQIASIHLAGDVTGLESIYLAASSSALEALTPVRAGFISSAAVAAVMETHPRVRAAFMRLTEIEKSISMQWTAVAGTGDAYQRVAHFLCEYVVRLRMRGLGMSSRVDMPITQLNIGDAVGLTAEHVNRTMRALDRAGLVSWQQRTLSIRDWDGLRHAANFDPAYLHARIDSDAAKLRT